MNNVSPAPWWIGILNHPRIRLITVFWFGRFIRVIYRNFLLAKPWNGLTNILAGFSRGQIIHLCIFVDRQLTGTWTKNAILRSIAKSSHHNKQQSLLVASQVISSLRDLIGLCQTTTNRCRWLNQADGFAVNSALFITLCDPSNGEGNFTSLWGQLLHLWGQILHLWGQILHRSYLIEGKSYTSLLYSPRHYWLQRRLKGSKRIKNGKRFIKYSVDMWVESLKV